MAEASTKECLGDFREHCRAALRAWSQGWKALIPDEFFQKTKEGQREALLAARSLIDVALDKLANEEPVEIKPKHKVKVEPS